MLSKLLWQRHKLGQLQQEWMMATVIVTLWLMLLQW
jgi:hypothetical protein